MTHRLEIWANPELVPNALAALREGTSAHELYVTNGSPHDAEQLKPTQIAFGHPDPEVLLQNQNLRWVHISSAGYTPWDRDDLRLHLQSLGAPMTNSSQVFQEPCAQHVLAMMLADARQLLPAYAEQLGARNWSSGHHRSGSFLLANQTVLLLGFGAIGRRLVELLAPFGVKVRAFRRSPQGDQGVEMVPVEGLRDALAEADFVIDLLPASESTRGFMSRERFGQMKPGARFFNIGRGTTVDQTALMEVLSEGRLQLAYLDVTDPEPLPADHPLWSAPRCYITPHTAGGHAGEQLRLVQHFLANLRRFEAGEELLDRVW